MSVLVSGAMVGCSADETFCLNDYQNASFLPPQTQSHNNHENGWEVYCLLSNGNEDETQFLLLNNIITINEKSYEIQKNGDRDKWVQFFETIDKE